MIKHQPDWRNNSETTVAFWRSDARDFLQAMRGCERCGSWHLLSFTTQDNRHMIPLDEAIEFCTFYCHVCHDYSPGARNKPNGDY